MEAEFARIKAATARVAEVEAEVTVTHRATSV